jgi:hypothetical protein
MYYYLYISQRILEKNLKKHDFKQQLRVQCIMC